MLKGQAKETRLKSQRDKTKTSKKLKGQDQKTKVQDQKS